MQDVDSAAAAEARDCMVESVSLYEAPALHVDPEELHKLLKEVKRVDALISGRAVPPQASLTPSCA